MKEILRLKDVSKEYGLRGFRTRVLNNINLAVNEGDFISIMGPSGAGKTTLLNLISTLDKPTKGEIIFDGKDITKIKNKELSNLRRDKIGFIFQDYNLLDNMNLMDNIALPLALGKKRTKAIEDKVMEISEIFGLKEHLKKYPYELSGGQKQRLSIARAIVRKPEIYIFDDSFSALDFKTDAILRKRLKSETKDSIVLIVAQRIGSIMDADKIIVLNEGEVVGIGKHKELLKTCEIYHEIAASQLTEEELA